MAFERKTSALETKLPRRAKRRRSWYPIECEHGYDCCPMCDGPRRDPGTLRIVEGELVK